MGAVALIVSWCCYRYTELFARVPFSRVLDWLADRTAVVALQPWAAGVTGVLIVAAVPAAISALVLFILAPLSWPLSIGLLLLCMGPQRLYELPGPTEAVASDMAGGVPTARQYHRLAARDVVGSLLWAVLFGAPGAVFYRAARELAESPSPVLAAAGGLGASANELFAVLYWLPARVYALAQVASGSGGRFEGAADWRVSVAVSDELIQRACGDEQAALQYGPRALLMVVVALVALLFIF